VQGSIQREDAEPPWGWVTTVQCDGVRLAAAVRLAGYQESGLVAALADVSALGSRAALPEGRGVRSRGKADTWSPLWALRFTAFERGSGIGAQGGNASRLGA